MYPPIPQASLEFLADLRRYLDGLDLSAAQEEYDRDELEPGPASLALWRQLGTDGWVAVNWPVEYGGKGRDAIDGWLYHEEMASRRLYAGGLTLSSIGPTLLAIGTEDQRRRLIPGMRTGDVLVAVAYTEPDAGTDLASLKLRARAVPGGYRLSGTKLYTTCANISTHLWVAARTATGSSKYDGITVFIVESDSPGLSVRPLITQAGGRTNEVVFDDVAVPAANVVGPVGEGWTVIRTALSFERVFPFAGVGAQLNALLRYCGQTTEPLPAATAGILMQNVVDVEVARLLAFRAAHLSTSKTQAAAAASMNKIWLTDLRLRLAGAGLDLLGAPGALGFDQAGAPLAGRYERMYRAATMRRFAGGANEVQREVVARTVLGRAG